MSGSRDWRAREGGTSTMLVLVIVAVLMVGGTMALRISASNVRSGGMAKERVGSIYVAEAGIERARAWLNQADEDAMAVALQQDDGVLFDNEEFGGGSYTVTLSEAPEYSPCPAGGSSDPLFEIYRDGVKTKTEVNVTFTALGAAITYGAGGPEIGVYAWASLDGGLNWTELFDGAEIDGEEEQAFENVGTNTDIMIKVRGKYSNKFDATYRTDDRSGHVILLKDGDEPPDYEAYDDQTSLEEFLQPILDSHGRISIGDNDVVMLSEIGASLTSSSCDFQDCVILVTFQSTTTVVGGPAMLDCDGTVLRVRSTATMRSGARTEVEAIVVKTLAGASASVPRDAAIMAVGPVQTNGNLVVDGNDHTLTGAYAGPGGLAISTKSSTYTRKGSSKVAGTTDGGRTYSTPTKTSSKVAVLTEKSSTDWTSPSTPDAVLGLSDGTLKSVAQSGASGSQYVTSPGDLNFPLSGVTYVELPAGGDWNAVHFGNSSGILVVHNNAGDAFIRNINDDSFTGIVVADDIAHIHCNIIGQVWSLAAAPSEGNCIGNGNGTVVYSSAAVDAALGLAQAAGTGSVRMMAYNEL